MLHTCERRAQHPQVVSMSPQTHPCSCLLTFSHLVHYIFTTSTWCDSKPRTRALTSQTLSSPHRHLKPLLTWSWVLALVIAAENKWNLVLLSVILQDDGVTYLLTHSLIRFIPVYFLISQYILYSIAYQWFPNCAWTESWNVQWNNVSRVWFLGIWLFWTWPCNWESWASLVYHRR